MKKLFVTGIGTGVGKTVVSAILTEYLRADYWKPVQTGTDEDSDTETVKGLISNTKSHFFPESYRFRLPLSPHAAARAEGAEIRLENIILPQSENEYLIIEGAGGLLVPLNSQHLIIDLIQKLEAEVVLVSRHYLGSINHTLLSLEALKSRKIPVKGIVFNGNPNPDTEEAIMRFSHNQMLFQIAEAENITKEFVRRITSSRILD